MGKDKKVEIEEKLGQTRAALLSFLQGLSAAEWETAVQAEDANWTIADVVRHLVNAESGMTTLIEKFKVGEDPVPPDFDRERFNKSRVRKSQDVPPAQLLAQLETNRVKLMAVLADLQPEDWQKKGRHASLRILTIEEVCQVIADHEGSHLEDLKKALKG